MKHPVTKYLEKNPLDNLIKTFNLKYNRHPLYPELIQLTYSHKSPKNSSIVNYCKGLVLNQAENFNIVSQPIVRFFNADIKQLYSRRFYISKKLDGVNIQLFHYKSNWYVATKGNLDPNGFYPNLFWKIWKTFNYKLPENINNTYVFELQHPDINSTIVETDTINLTLIAVVDTIDVHQENVNIQMYADKYDWNCIQYEIISCRELSLIAQKYKSLKEKEEGIVIIPLSDFNKFKVNRYKLKSNFYQLKHKLFFKILNEKKLFNYIIQSPLEVLDIIQDLKKNTDYYYTLYNNLMKKIEWYSNYVYKEWLCICGEKTQKEFVENIANKTISDVLCFIYKKTKNCSFNRKDKDFINNIIHLFINKYPKTHILFEKINELYQQRTLVKDIKF